MFSHTTFIQKIAKILLLLSAFSIFSSTAFAGKRKKNRTSQLVAEESTRDDNVGGADEITADADASADAADEITADADASTDAADEITADATSEIQKITLQDLLTGKITLEDLLEEDISIENLEKLNQQSLNKTQRANLKALKEEEKKLRRQSKRVPKERKSKKFHGDAQNAENATPEQEQYYDTLIQHLTDLYLDEQIEEFYYTEALRILNDLKFWHTHNKIICEELSRSGKSETYGERLSFHPEEVDISFELKASLLLDTIRSAAKFIEEHNLPVVERYKNFKPTGCIEARIEHGLGIWHKDQAARIRQHAELALEEKSITAVESAHDAVYLMIQSNVEELAKILEPYDVESPQYNIALRDISNRVEELFLQRGISRGSDGLKIDRSLIRAAVKATFMVTPKSTPQSTPHNSPKRVGLLSSPKRVGLLSSPTRPVPRSPSRTSPLRQISTSSASSEESPHREKSHLPHHVVTAHQDYAGLTKRILHLDLKEEQQLIAANLASLEHIREVLLRNGRTIKSCRVRHVASNGNCGLSALRSNRRDFIQAVYNAYTTEGTNPAIMALIEQAIIADGAQDIHTWAEIFNQQNEDGEFGHWMTNIHLELYAFLFHVHVNVYALNHDDNMFVHIQEFNVDAPEEAHIVHVNTAPIQIHGGIAANMALNHFVGLDIEDETQFNPPELTVDAHAAPVDGDASATLPPTLSLEELIRRGLTSQMPPRLEFLKRL